MLDDCLQSLYELKSLYYYASVVRVFEVDKPKQCMPKANIYRKMSNIYWDCIKHKIDVVIIILRKGHLM